MGCFGFQFLFLFDYIFYFLQYYFKVIFFMVLFVYFLGCFINRNDQLVEVRLYSFFGISVIKEMIIGGGNGIDVFFIGMLNYF